MVDLTFKPAYPAQDAFFHSEATFSMLSGGVGSGKSYPGCFLVFYRGQKYPGDRALICRKNQSTIKESTWQTLVRIVPKQLVVEQSDHKMFMKLRTSIPGVFSTINCIGLDKKAGEEYPQKIGSTEYGTIFIDEGSETDRGDFGMLASRLRFVPEPSNDTKYSHIYKDYRNRFFTATNPEGPHHYLAELFIHNSPPAQHGERAFWMSSPYDNRKNLRAGYIEMLESTYPEGSVMRDRLLRGQWVLATGLIYSAFSYSDHVTDIDFLRKEDGNIDYGAYKDIIAGADSNYPKPRACVVCGMRGDGRVDVLSEYYQPASHIEDLQAWLETKAEEYGRSITIYHDPSAPAFIDKLNSGKGLLCYKANNKVNEGITAVARHFTMKTVRINPLCVGLVKEIPGYRWKTGEKEEPVKENDHACDALRYAIVSYESGREEYRVFEDPEGIVF